MFDHYIALDWAQRNMAIARMTQNSDKASVIDVKADIFELKVYLRQLSGSKILTFEESNPAQWLYTELVSEVDELVVCDPYRNKLLKEGHKSDKLDAERLCLLLKNNLIKPVFHCTDDFFRIRKLVSGYDDLISTIVRLKNQRNALFRAQGKDNNEALIYAEDNFVVKQLDDQLEFLHVHRLEYEKEFRRLLKEHKIIRNIESVPGIGFKNAVKLAAVVVEPRRFRTKTHFLNYCGLLTLDALSGGNSYGKRKSRHSRQLKSIFKIAALACIKSENPLNAFYRNLLSTGYPEFKARHALARRIAVLTYGVMKENKKFDLKRIEALKH